MERRTLLFPSKSMDLALMELEAPTELQKNVTLCVQLLLRSSSTTKINQNL